MSKSRIIWLILLVVASFGVVQAQFVNPPDLLIYNAWVRPTAALPAEGATPEAPIPGSVSGAYVTIENTGDTNYRLVGVNAGFAEMSMLHQTTIDDKGVMRMQMVMGGVEIPPGETVQLAPGSYHVMLMNLTENVYPAQTISMTLTFEDADGATFDMPVGTLVTDLPPEDDTLVAANAVAQPDMFDDQALAIAFVLENRGDQAESLVGFSVGAEATVELAQNPLLSKMAMLPLEIPAGGAFVFQPDDVFLKTDLLLTPGNSFPLTLEFASGKTLTVAVPVVGADS